MVDPQIINQIIEILLSKIESKDQEQGRLLVHDDFEKYDSRINLWAIRENIRDLKETTITDLDDFPGVEVKVTYAPPMFFTDVLQGKNVAYWQVATVIRLLKNCEIIFDPNGKMLQWVEQAPHIGWNSETIELKRQTTRLLLERMNNRIRDDMIADAYIWLIKAAEEAICVPLMIQNAFDVGTATLMLDAVKELDEEIYDFFTNLLQIKAISPDKLEKARKELENLADHLYKNNIKTDREMWILAAFVSINESERRLNQCLKTDNPEEANKLFETAIGELWQAYFLVAQNPKLDIKLDPWVVSSFWRWFGFPELDENWLLNHAKRVEELIST
ncbi:MAG: hypothetical protein ACFFAJ_00035 [Candidatus Hodarchaeota archaeon]